MAWYDDIWDFAKDIGGSAMDFAKENPALTGAGLGLAANAAAGGGGENNLAAAGLGAALGTGASMAYDAYNAGSYNPSGNAAPAAPAAPNTSSGVTGPQGTGSSAANAGTGAGPAAATDGWVSPGASAAVVGNQGVTGDTGGTMMGPPASAAGDPTLANRLSMGMNSAKAGLQTVRDFGKQNEDVLSLGGKALSAYLGNQAKAGSTAPVQDYTSKYRATTDAINAENAGIVGKQNAVADQQLADASAINPQRSGQQAYASTLSRISGQAEQNAATEASKGYSAATVAANKRRGMVGASTGATTAAESARASAEGTRRAGLGAVKYQQQSAPSYDTNYVNGLGTANGDTSKSTEGAMALFDDALGLSKQKAQQQVGELTWAS